MMKKVLFVIPSLSGGGSERVASILANKMSNKDYDVTVICLLKKEHTYFTDEKVNVIFIESDIKSRVKRNVSKFTQFVKALKKIKPDIVVSFTYDCSMITSLATRFIKTKLIISERNDPNNDPSSSALRKVRNLLYKLGDGFVFQTFDARDYYGNKIAKNSVVIGNPLNEKLPQPYEGKRDKRIVCVSRLAPQKNIKLLIDAFKNGIDKLDGYKLELYGDGPLRDEIDQYITDIGLEDRIIMKGYSKNVYADIQTADIFAIPSDYEGLSNSMLEALALGIPVIATNCPIGGAKMFIKSYENGILVEVGDLEGLTKELTNLANHEELKAKLSRESVKIRSILNPDKIVEQWISYINSVE